MPFLIGDSNELNTQYVQNLLEKPIKNNKDELLGKVVSQQNNIFVASVNYLDYEIKDLNIEGTPIKVI